MPSWHHKGDGHYHPAMHQPYNCQTAGSLNTPDIINKDLGKFCTNRDQKYQKNLKFLLEANTDVEFQSQHLSVLWVCASRHYIVVYPINHFLYQTYLLWTLCIWQPSMTWICFSSYSLASLTYTHQMTNQHGTALCSTTTHPFGMHMGKPSSIWCNTYHHLLAEHLGILQRESTLDTKPGRFNGISMALDQHYFVIFYLTNTGLTSVS